MIGSIKSSLVSVSGLSAIAAATIATPALAQDGQRTAAEEQHDVNVITVTAQRRSESLQDVPVSLTVVSDEMLASRGLNEIGDLKLAAPSLQVGADNQFAIRGVGTVSFADTLESSVSTAIDEVNTGRSFGAGAVFNDIERVEVLSGPQGLLFGKNASAGLINIITKKPQLGVVEGSFDAEYVLRDTSVDNGQGVIVKGVLNLPTSETTALRFNAFYSHQDPVAKFIGTGSSDANLRAYGGRAKFYGEFGTGFSIYLIGEYNERHGIANSFDRTYRELGPGSGNVAALTAAGITAGPENFYYAGEGEFFRDESNGGLQAKLAYEFGSGWEISNIAAWRFSKRDQALDTDLLNVDGLTINNRKSDLDQFSNELRLAMPAGERLNGQVGVFYLESTLNSSGQLAGMGGMPAFLLPNMPFCVGTVVAPACPTARDYFLGVDNDYTLKERNMALFGQFNFEVTPEFQLLAGARLTREDLSIDTVQNTMSTYFTKLGINGEFAEDYDNTSLSWKFGGQYNPTPEIMVYANYGKGYKGAGFNDRKTKLDSPLLVEPEAAKSLEGGIKTSWLGNNLLFNVSLYRTKFTNYQVQSFDPALQTFTIQNAASLTTKGAEFTLIARPVSGLTINASATLQDATFDSFEGAQCNPGQTCGSDGTFDAAGTKLPTAPDFSGTVQVMYEGQLSNSLGFFVESNLYHRSSINYRIGEPAITRLPSVEILGASVGLVLDDRYTLRLFCRNCTDERVPTFLTVDSGDANSGIATSIQQWGISSVRNIGLSFGAQF